VEVAALPPKSNGTKVVDGSTEIHYENEDEGWLQITHYDCGLGA